MRINSLSTNVVSVVLLHCFRLFRKLTQSRYRFKMIPTSEDRETIIWEYDDSKVFISISKTVLDFFK